jgi:acetyltransferase-like isoleucine patch superfamily enzyme
MWRLLRYDLPLHFVLRFTNWLPDNVVFIRLRGRLARPFFGSCGKKLGIGRDVTFYNSSNIHIGNWVYVAKGSWFSASESITIEDEVLFGPYVCVASSNHTLLDGSYRFGKPDKGPVLIKKGSWIGAHGVILKGTVLGQGTVLAANSVLTKPSEDNSVYAGVPAKKIV